MTQDEILSTMQELIAGVKQDTTPVRPQDVRADTPLVGPPLSMDSLDFVRFLVEVEEAFGIVADEAEFLRLPTVGAGVQLIAGLLDGPGTGGSARPS
jgi:acyl carrier protein